MQIKLTVFWFVLLFVAGLLVGCASDPPSADEEAPAQVVPSMAAGPASSTALPPTSVTPGDCPSYRPGFSLATGVALQPMPDLPEPLPRQWFADPVFGTCLVRVTDRDHDLAAEDASAGLKNEYSRVQAFNADGTRILVRGIDGTYYLYDALTLLPLGQVSVGDEPRWDASDPNLLYFVDETRLLSYDAQTGEQSLVREFADDFPGQDLAAVWTRYEGSPSRDRRYWAFMAEDGDWLPVAFVVYDLESDQVLIRDMRGVPGIEEDVDHVTVSPLGTYLLASFDRSCEQGALGTDAQPCGLMVYDRDLSRGRGLLRVIGHYDPALDAQGREVIVYQDIDTDHISMLDLATGQVTPLLEIDYARSNTGLHFSGLAYDRPGWAVVSTHDGSRDSHIWMEDQVFAVELKPDGRVIRLAHTQSLVDEDQEHDYWAEPHASTNPDLSRVLFTSNWGRSGSGEVEMFMIALPPDW